VRQTREEIGLDLARPALGRLEVAPTCASARRRAWWRSASRSPGRPELNHRCRRRWVLLAPSPGATARLTAAPRHRPAPSGSRIRPTAIADELLANAQAPPLTERRAGTAGL
jgi:hypothetical protein